MAQVDKVQVQSTTYDIAQSASATFAGTSNDNTAPSSWTDVDKLVSGETNGSIFTKISKMFSNIRWLYNQLGTTDYSGTGASTVSAALAALQGGKAAASHSHTVSSLPVSSTQVNSSAYIPTSSLIYSMNQTLTSLNDAWKVRSPVTRLSILYFDNGGQRCLAFYVDESSGGYYDLGFFCTQKRIDFSYHKNGTTTLYWSITS